MIRFVLPAVLLVFCIASLIYDNRKNKKQKTDEEIKQKWARYKIKNEG